MTDPLWVVVLRQAAAGFEVTHAGPARVLVGDVATEGGAGGVKLAPGLVVTLRPGALADASWSADPGGHVETVRGCGIVTPVSTDGSRVPGDPEVVLADRGPRTSPLDLDLEAILLSERESVLATLTCAAWGPGLSAALRSSSDGLVRDERVDGVLTAALVLDEHAVLVPRGAWGSVEFATLGSARVRTGDRV